MDEWLWQLDGAGLGSTGRGAAPRLDDVTLTIRPGITAVLGYSGAGKTSLLNVLVGYERLNRGSLKGMVLERGKQASPAPGGTGMAAGGQALSWAPQDDGLWPHLTARQHLALVAPNDAARQRIEIILAALDLKDVAHAHPERLSRGERSRLSVARALASGAAVLVMDEPLAHVDPSRQGRYWDFMIAHVKQRGGSLVFATHQPRVVLAHAERAVVMRGGRVLGEGAVDDLYWKPATPELAESLGDGNWLEPSDAATWLGAELSHGVCIRPERLEMAESEAGPLAVVSSQSLAAVTETMVSHPQSMVQRRFVHRTPLRPLRSGARVTLRATMEGAPHS